MQTKLLWVTHAVNTAHLIFRFFCGLAVYIVVQAHAAASETSGAMVKIPIVEDHVRSLNLAVSVGVGLYEAIRQLDSQKLTASTTEL